MNLKEILKKFVSSTRVELNVKGQRLVGRLFMPEIEGKMPGVVFYHGKSSSKENYLPIGKELALWGMGAFCFDFRGCGESKGDEEDLDLTDNLDDAERTFWYLTHLPSVYKQPIGICGVSRGGYLAAIVAGKNPNVASLILRAPASYVKGKPSSVSEESLSIQAIREFKGSLLVIESENDEEIPRELIQLYLDNAVQAKSKDHVILKGAKHYLGPNNSPFRTEFRRLVVDWFKQTLPN